MFKWHAACLAALASVCFVPGSAPAQTDTRPTTCPALGEPLEFETYWVGPRFDGLELIRVSYVCAPAHLPVGSQLIYTYESCPEFDAGCDDRIQLDVTSVPLTPGHRDNLDTFGKKTTVGGFEGRVDGTQLTIYLPETTVFIGPGDAQPYDDTYRSVWYEIGRSLSEGPRVLADLDGYGIRMDCPDTSRCEGKSVSPLGLSTFQRVLNVLGAVLLILLFGAGPLLIFRRRGSHAVFVPHRKSRRVGVLLLLSAAFTSVALTRLLSELILVGLALTIGAFLVGGASLRPRASFGRGIALGAIAYLLIGLLLHLGFSRPESLAELFEPEQLAFTVLMWPGLVGSFFGGYLGR
jgi:hypothetical protein